MLRALIVRRFVLWLVIALLPVQGYAAATMVACGPSHERMAAASAASLVHDHDRAHDRDHDSASHHGHDHAAHAPAAHDHAGPASHAPAVMPDDSAGSSHDLADYTCSACAACCVGAALPAGDVSLDLSAPAPDALRPSTTAPLAAVTLDGLERPPRSFLAD